MIVNIRGSHGAGKSTAVRAVMSAARSCHPIFGVLGPRLPEAYQLMLPYGHVSAFVVGPYTSPCGGCDRIARNATVMELIAKYAERGHVLFEGALISSCYGATGTFLERWGKDSLLVFLDTPLEECLRRVEARRGRERDEHLTKNVTQKYESCLRVRRKVEAESKMLSIVTSVEKASGIVCNLLRNNAFALFAWPA